MTLVERMYANRGAASAAAAERLHELLRSALDGGGHGALVVSGGSTPRDAFDDLGRRSLPWSRVTIVPSDERWVAPEHEASNERMLRETLLHGPAGDATLFRIHRDNTAAAQAPVALQAELQSVTRPFAGSLLGMGDDGHFASLFPDFAGLDAALDAQNPATFVAVETAASPHARISLTLSALLDSREIILLMFGDEKRRVYDEAKAARDARLPVSYLLHQSRTPVRVIWAP